VAMGVNVDERDACGVTALHQAAANGRVEMVEVLLQLGADKEAKCDAGLTSLHYAVATGGWR
jgi:ankyrin repeat protein